MAQETVTLQDGTLVQVADFDFGFVLNDEGKAITEAEDGSIYIEGYASDFGEDRQDEAFEPGAFDAGIKAFMDNPVLLYHHKYDTALGAVEEMKLDAKGLFVRARVDAPEPHTAVADYVRKIKSGVLKGFSVGGKFYRRMTASGPRIFKCDLREISVTPMPVNPRMLFAVAGKAFANMEDMDSPAEVDTTTIEARLAALDETFSQLEGKASGHPDGPAVAALQYHLQQIHTLATNTKQDSQGDDTRKETNDLANHVAKTAKEALSKVHNVAKKIGPLPNLPSYYGSSSL